MNKLFDVFAQIKRQTKGDEKPLDESALPLLWILSPTASDSILNGFRASIDEENWGEGVYFLGDYLRTVIVAIHQLPPIQETLWLRILGKGRVQKQAIDELEALPNNHPLRAKAIDLLLSLKTTLEVNQNIDQEDRDLIMRLSAIYEQKLAEAKQEGIQAERRQVIENLLQVRFGTLDAELSAIIEPLLLLTPQEFTPLLLQLSREELLERFR
ncbi:hypothetical protein NIES2111_09200 [Nostoc sp. NIES-2111]|nr:hypothetical protein NIES2111_09200 [Nostoc sp. NIES-2111]